jgi:glyoxylase-like metal-dependent hydrolase (beta-lactamase superfamily II)|tara:strand:+ start:510 stop:1160 length:651 start_codon:yes stop_codon:yes gene_type:complete
MITLKKFTFNPFQVNTYLISDETGECIIIDPAMDGSIEEAEIAEYIKIHNLTPVMLLLTHAHVDHIGGTNFMVEKYGLKLTAHRDCVPFLTNASAYASTFGLSIDSRMEIQNFIDENNEVKFGNSVLKVLFTPGHANGSLCFYSPESNFVITGDVLFNQSIGRTDLPTGNYDLLQNSIWEKLFTLPDDTVVYPGHGPETTIGFEKVNNPFVAIGRG